MYMDKPHSGLIDLRRLKEPKVKGRFEVLIEYIKKWRDTRRKEKNQQAFKNLQKNQARLLNNKYS